MVTGTLEKPPTLKYPKSVAFIISNEFCERFNYYGMRTILVFYLTRKLLFSNDQATIIFHIFASLVYLFPVFGAIIADSWLGRFKTILYLSIVYTIGSVVIALGAVPTLHLPATAATFIGLLLIAIGTGGIKPCVSAFGGDQFQLPEQAKFLVTFFSLFYMSINAGSLLSTTITPLLRERHCFGELSCFSLAFGVPGLLMVVSIVIFVIGKPFYTVKEPAGNMLLNVAKCIVNALKTKSKEQLTKPRYHWLDYAEQKCGKQLVYDVKCLMKILVLYVPLPIFWALYDQQSSRWTFQAEQMSGYISKSFSIKPDQMQVLNPLIVVFCIPLFNFIIYPLLEKIGIKTPLQKMTLGMALTGVAFAISGFLELSLQETYPVIPRDGEGQLRLFNSQPCRFRLDTSIPQHASIMLEPNSQWTEKHIALKANESLTSFQYNVSITDGSPTNCRLKAPAGELQVRSAEALSYFLTSTGDFVRYTDSPKKSKSTLPLVRILLSSDYSDVTANVGAMGVADREVIFQNAEHVSDGTEFKFSSNLTESHEIDPGTYLIWINGTQVGAVDMQQGGSYTLVVNQMGASHYSAQMHTLVNPNSIHITWQVPQYIVITAGEIMFSVTGLEFSFTQAPESMKSVLQALWLLTVTFGNVLVVVIAKIKISESQAVEFFFYAVLMAFDICLFIYLAIKYKYRNESDLSPNDDRTGVVVNMNGNSGHTMNQTFTTGHGPTVAAIASRSPISNGSISDENLDSSPKCLKQRPTSGKHGADNYGYSDI